MVKKIFHILLWNIFPCTSKSHVGKNDDRTIGVILSYYWAYPIPDGTIRFYSTLKVIIDEKIQCPETASISWKRRWTRLGNAVGRYIHVSTNLDLKEACLI